jgi:DNA-binding MarR family transcriptional regulator
MPVLLVDMAETRWLDADEMRAWLAYVGATTLLDDFLDQQLRRDAGITHADYFLLAYLSSLPDRALGLTQLAEALRFTRSRLTRAICRLEQAGYVERRGHPTDGRSQFAVLTDHGFALLTRAAPGHVAAVRRAVFDALTPDQVRHVAEINEAILHQLTCLDPPTAYPADLPWRRR